MHTANLLEMTEVSLPIIPVTPLPTNRQSYNAVRHDLGLPCLESVCWRCELLG